MRKEGGAPKQWHTHGAVSRHVLHTCVRVHAHTDLGGAGKGAHVSLFLAGPERLKEALTALGLKCGGTPKERAQRLWLTRSTPLHALDRKLFAKARPRTCARVHNCVMAHKMHGLLAMASGWCASRSQPVAALVHALVRAASAPCFLACCAAQEHCRCQHAGCRATSACKWRHHSGPGGPGWSGQASGSSA